jgi:uncharacterized protein YjiS (DUF1127 family)
MITIFDVPVLGYSVVLKLRLWSLFRSYWDASQKRRQRRKLRAALCDLSDRELIDIGTTGGEIDYIASNEDIDPRGVQSAERLGHLPTVDGQVGLSWTHQHPRVDFR